MLVELSLVVACVVAALLAVRRLREARERQGVLAVLALGAVAAAVPQLSESWPLALRMVAAATLVGWGARLGWPDSRWPPAATSLLATATWGVATLAVATAVPPSIPLGRGAAWVLSIAGAASAAALVTLRFDRSSTRVRTLGRGVMTATVAGLAAFGVAEGVWELADNFGRNGWEIYDVGRGSTPDDGGRSTWRGVFGRLQEFAIPIARNDLGFRDRDHNEIPAPGVFRFAVLGDSFVEALQVPLDQTLTSRLEQRFTGRIGRPAEGLAFGRSGTGLASHRDLLASTVLGFGPRLVIVCFLPGNDLRDDSPVLTVRERQLNGFRLNRTAVGRLARARRLQLAGAALVRLDRALAAGRQRGFPFDERVYRDPPLDDDWAAAWTGTEAVVRDLQRLWTDGQARGVLVVIPSRLEMEAAADPVAVNADLARRAVRAGLPPDGWDFRGPARRMGGIAGDLGIPVLDLATEWARLPPADREGLYWRDDGHWTAAGHELAAATLDRFLAERPEMLESPNAEIPR